MPSLNLDLDYWDNKKTRRLVGLLGRGSEVLPIRLWTFVAKNHAETGKLTGYSAQEIAGAISCWFDPVKTIEALVKVGFLDPIEGGYQVHDWEEHAGHLIVFKKRAKTAAKAKWAKYDSKLEETNKPNQNMLEASLKHPTSILEASLKQCPINSNQDNTRKSDFLNEVEKTKIFDVIIAATGWGPSSQAVQTAFRDVLALTEKNADDNPFGYALKCAQNYGKPNPKKVAIQKPEESFT